MKLLSLTSFFLNVGFGEKVTSRVLNYALYHELNLIRPFHSSSAEIVYKDMSESSVAGQNVVLPPRYEDL